MFQHRNLDKLFKEITVDGDGKCLMRSFLECLGQDLSQLDLANKLFIGFLLEHEVLTYNLYQSYFPNITDFYSRLRAIVQGTLSGQTWPVVDLFYMWAVMTSECNICVLTCQKDELLLTYVDAKWKFIVDLKYDMNFLRVIDVKKTIFFYLKDHHFSALLPQFKESNQSFLNATSRFEAEDCLRRFPNCVISDLIKA